MLGTIDWMFILAILLFIAGFILIGIEMVTPGLHAPGFFGAASLLIAIFLVSDTFIEGTLITIVVLALLTIMLGIILGLLSSGKLKSPIILEEQQNRDKGYISARKLDYMLGKQGVALTDLRPAGTAKIDGINYDVITEGSYIMRDTKIIVYKVEGSKLIVKVQE